MPDRADPSLGGRTKPVLPLSVALFTAAVAGIALDMSFPDLGIWPLAFVGVALSLLTLIGRSVWGAFAVGLVFGAAFYLLHVEWAARYLGVVPWFALAGVEAVLTAVAAIPIALAYRWFPQGARLRLMVLPLLIGGLWTAREIFLGSWPYTGFPWGRLGMSQSLSPLSHVTSWLGVSGLTFLMVVLCAAVVEVVRVAVRHRPGTRRLLVAALPSALVAALLLATPQWQTAPAGTLRVGSVQGNGPSGYFDHRESGDIMRAQLEATSPLLEEDMDVLLWPEGGLDSDPVTDQSTAQTLDALSARLDAPLIVNAVTSDDDLFYNSSLLWRAGEGVVQMHSKRYPVPFGEYVPDRWFYNALAPDLIGLIQREYARGTDPPLFDLDGVKVGLAICFDVIYDQVIREGAQDGAQVYMFQTNNADFRDTDENLQQLAFARMRAIETGRSVVNISTVGTSQVIGPDGSTIDSLPAGQPGAMLTDVELRDGLTPGVVLGPWVQAALVWGSLAAVVVLGFATRLRRRRGARAPR